LKVIQGQQSWCQSKAYHLDHKARNSSPNPCLMPRSGNPLAFLDETYMGKLEVLGYCDQTEGQ